MRRAVARGRMFPQSFSTDRRYGRLSVKAIGLFPLMWANADDQGRLCGDPEEVKYAVCPNIDHITKADVPGLLRELQDNKLILCYKTPKSAAIQILDWWDANQKMQWAWPSEYTPPDNWNDHLRYKKDAHTVMTLNWPVSGETSEGTQVSAPDISGEPSGERGDDSQVGAPDSSGEEDVNTPPKTPSNNKTIKRTINRRGRGNSPEASGEKTASAENDIFKVLKENFRIRWGKRLPPNYMETEPLEPNAKQLAQMRDLAKELSAAGGCRVTTIKEAFDEAGGMGKHKQHISYVRGILLDWLDIPRDRK